LASFKCPLCGSKYTSKAFLHNHMESVHKDQLNGISPARYVFNKKYNKTEGKCIVCSKSTKWNEATERYERICDRPTNCSEKYREMFRKRMIARYGKDTLLDDPEVQKKMLDSRKISDEYTWRDGTKTKYTGTYERDFLEFLDVFLHFEPSDVKSPAPQVFSYVDKEGKKRFYIPDFFITSINTIVEIKAYDNKHYRARDIEKEKAKDRILEKSSFNYVKVHDKNYDEFYDFLKNLNN
jgi:hypothetical protein